MMPHCVGLGTHSSKLARQKALPCHAMPVVAWTVHTVKGLTFWSHMGTTHVVWNFWDAVLWSYGNL